jgi:quinoprotein dehydrogenase-associated probable ABC transporter substrate-binding protein
MSARHPGPASRGAARCVVATALASLSVVAAAQAPSPAPEAEEPGARTAFRVCQDPNNLPFSNLAGEGYENKIAELFARDLGVPVKYYSFPNRLGFIRQTLRFKLPDSDYPCDVVLGVPEGFDQVSATQPYYASTYALVLPVGRDPALDAVKNQADFLALPPAVLAKLRIGVVDRSPASAWLDHHNLLANGVPYKIMNADPDAYPGQLIDQELAHGRIDVAIAWGPIAGYYARRVGQPKLRVIPMTSEPGVPFEYAMAMGVRYGEPNWKHQVEGLIARHHDEILAILRDYGVPLVDPAVAAKP